MGVNTIGQLTVSALVPVSKLIAEHIKPIPPTIYNLFQSVIDARKATHAVFQQMVFKNPDPEIERSNISHRHFIDSLTEAFKALGGENWISKQKSESERLDEEDRDEVIFSNQFMALKIGESNDAEVENEASDGPSPETPSARPRKKTAAKAKKGKKGRNVKKETPVEEPPLVEIPLESYRIVEDETGIVTEYLMAVYLLVKQWIELRDYVQGIWHEVAYDNLNSAVAGAVSNIATAMVKQTQSAIFVNFPGHDSYETVMNTITRGNIEKSQGMFSMALHKVDPNGKVVGEAQENAIDIKEQFLVHAYQNLLDFIMDFQKTRSGKPTKAMLAEIRDWNPELNLQKASKQQRIKWRRSYTINWLYDEGPTLGIRNCGLVNYWAME